MIFDLTEDQRLLQALVERFANDRYDLDKRRRALATPQGYDPANWAALAELGLLALPFPEDLGGLGGGPVEIMLAMAAFGRALVVEPFVSCAILAGGLLQSAGRGADVAAIVSGERVATLAHSEPTARYSLASVATEARKAGDQVLITGEKRLVLHAASADVLLVSARPAPTVPVALYAVDRTAPGLMMRSYRTVDGSPAADVSMRSVPAVLVADDALGLIQTHVTRACFAFAAEGLGCIEALFETTLTYVKTRQQFGQPIGRFQVIQHRMADLYMLVEQARAVVMRAALASDEDGSSWHQEVAAAKAFIGLAGRKIGHEAIQLHGGMGMTDELVVSHLHKRLLMIQMLFGDAAHHMDAYAELALAG
jgi:alkylation response protein AidB-like acyl-CoA dehydrogenase